jgi:Vacuolar protein sorting-associated protein 62
MGRDHETSDALLLARYLPFVRYDSLESFAADSPAAMTDCAPSGFPRGNTLGRSWRRILASATPADGETQLDLDLLRAGRYRDGAKVRAGDRLDAVGRRYLEDAREMHSRPGYADQVYGYANRNQPGALWLQYWFFYYYNDKALLGSGRHEGDWELVQLGLGNGERPLTVTYSQHTAGERCTWDEVEKEAGPEGEAPVVYVARGSHACYFRPGVYAQAPIVPDHNDAAGPLVRPNLNVIDDDDPAWIGWPGRWGSTSHWLKLPFLTLGADSPPGPAQHGAWEDPHRFHLQAREAKQLRPVVGAELARPATPVVEARRRAGRAVVSYRLPHPDPDLPAAERVLLSLDGHRDGLPPATYCYPARSEGDEIELPLALEDRAYTVRAAAAARNGLTGPAAAVELLVREPVRGGRT